MASFRIRDDVHCPLSSQLDSHWMQALAAFDKNLYLFTFAEHHYDHMEGSPGLNLPEVQKDQWFFQTHIVHQADFLLRTNKYDAKNKKTKRKTYVEMPHCNTVALPVPIATYLMWKSSMVKSKLRFADIGSGVNLVYWKVQVGLKSNEIFSISTTIWLSFLYSCHF